MKQGVNWRRNLWILLFGTFITGVAFNEIIPFMSLFIIQLGHFTHNQLSILSGIVYAASFFVVAFTAPFWGAFADRHGRKRMILQTSLGSAVVIALMAFVTNVDQFIFLRFLQGVFDGVIPNSIALVATETPKKHVEWALSVLSIGYVGGMLIGPIIGGYLVAIFSIRLTFIITGLLLFAFFGLSALAVKENFTPPKNSKKMHFSIHVFRRFPKPRFIMWMLITTISIQICINLIFPIITLFVKQLMHNQGPISQVAGIISALPGIAMVMTSTPMGKYGENHGTGKVLMLGFWIGIIFYFPQGFATGVWMLGLFRFLNGISNAALFPAIQTLLAKNTPQQSTGMAFSLNQSAQAIGAVIGATFGGLISNLLGYRGVFFCAGIILIINLILLKLFVPELKKE
ncbi:MFS transporter [Philodulcilactobacillus myokoensis]|uniref:MFS transporter n=1 Tax=Philodulcilactobacillus myokoensis TaxID=2929573 RepID=A0A9W6B0S8_9LACO|nr:MFS transporter [Philodulcilactobacillus myokoensis]GLB46441.1 MFS transporter [Philodulcilactobacillus myokoensis]